MMSLSDFVVSLSLKITDKLVDAQIEAEHMAGRNDFAEKYHNGRADGLVEARKIVESILSNIDEESLKKELEIKKKKK